MNQSQQLLKIAQKFIPGGVNSPVRAFKGVGGDPLFIASGKGAYIYDADGKEYIDYVGSWGPMILGHAHPEVIAAVAACAKKGLSFGAPTEVEVQLAQKITELMPSMEQVRMVNSGTEATMSAIRLARGFTGRDKFIKFNGCYHGHADPLLVAAGSGGLTFGVPNSAGVPNSSAEHTLIAEFNDLNSVKYWFEHFPEDIAAIIVEPVPGNMNCIPPLPGFLQSLRELCTQYGALLIFDEVMTGFRVALGGAQALYDVKPDLTTLGKIIGGGMPVGAFGGSRDIMQCLSPVGNVYQAGTLSGNPVAMTAGLTTLELIAKDEKFYEKLTQATVRLMTGLKACAKDLDVALQTTAVGGMFGLFFTEKTSVNCFDDVKACDVNLFKRFFHEMLRNGVYLAPSAYEAGFVSAAHAEEEIAKTLATARAALMACYA